jgi:NAD(P)-dependent dehydrogenase (short-subunit alcohol dehydrogenase family)
MARSVDSGRVPSGAVVITGTSTGIGRACALRLDASGFDVFATVRREEDAEKLRSEAAGIHPLVVDVTDQDGVAAVAREVDAAVGERGVAGLVNNAGMSVGGPLEFLPLDDLRRQLEVNLVAHVGVTQAFLPAIRRATGRIVNMTSVGGRVANPFLGPYHASKWGLEAISDSLRKELRPWGIHVIAIEPGSIDTEIWRKGTEQAEELAAGLPEEGHRLYDDKIPKMLEMAQRLAEHSIPADRVAKVVERALTADRPRARYVVGVDARALITLNQLLPDRAYDALEARLMGI